MNSNNKLLISLSAEHSDEINRVKDCFGELNTEVRANYVRASAGDLPMHVTIFVGSAVAGGIIWDLIKLGIKNIYKRFRNVNVVVRDKENVIYHVKADFTVKVIVVPERKNEFEPIKNFEDMVQHIEKQNEEEDDIQNRP